MNIFIQTTNIIKIYNIPKFTIYITIITITLLSLLNNQLEFN